MRKLLVLLTFGLLAAFALATRPGGNAPVVHAATPTVFNFSGAEVIYMVPAGTTRVLVEARGAKGGDTAAVTLNPNCPTGALGGRGQQVTTILTVTPGQNLFVNVGDVGTVTAGGFNGGGVGGTHTVLTERGAGGGGGSDVRTAAANPATRVIVAGGGGGAGGCGNGSAGGSGLGGAGGIAGANGANGTTSPASGGGGLGAVGGTPGAAGLHGSAGAPPTAGNVLGVGGNGGVGLAQTVQTGSGGGGGGGFAGGGGGGAGPQGGTGGGGGGGGGGSSFAGAGTAGTITITHPDAASLGRVTITPIDPLTVTKSFNPGTIQVNGTSIVGIVLTNGNAFPLTGIAFTDVLPSGVTINGALTTFGGNPLCTGASATPPSTIQVTAGTLAANATCAIGVPVTSAVAGTYVNPSFTVTTTEGVSSSSAPATLLVTALPPTITVTPPATPTATPTTTPVIVFVPPVIPQVFQHVPQGIFNGSRNNTPTPVVRAAVVAPVIDPGAMPVLRPPSTGDAGLKEQRGTSFVALIALAGVLSITAGAAWRLRPR